MITPINKVALYQEVMSRIIDDVKGGVWSPGDLLPTENEFANRFSISRNSVREALKALGHMGIVVSKAGLGTFLSPDALRKIENHELMRTMFKDSSAYELMQVRLIIEPQLTGLAAANATDKDKEELSKLYQSIELRLTECEEKGLVINPSEEGIDFHMKIAQIANNEILTKFLTSIRSELESQRSFLRLSCTEYTRAMIADHKAIYEAITNNDPEKASSAMYKHLQNTFDIILSEK